MGCAEDGIFGFECKVELDHSIKENNEILKTHEWNMQERCYTMKGQNLRIVHLKEGD